MSCYVSPLRKAIIASSKNWRKGGAIVVHLWPQPGGDFIQCYPAHCRECFRERQCDESPDANGQDDELPPDVKDAIEAALRMTPDRPGTAKLAQELLSRLTGLPVKMPPPPRSLGLVATKHRT